MTNARRLLLALAVLTLLATACASDDATVATPTDDGGGDAATPADDGATPADDGATPADDGGGGADLSGQSFKVGSKEFTENVILGQIAIQVLQDAGAEVEDLTGLIGSATVREALTSGEVDMYWDYTGTGWVQILGNEPTNFPDDLYSAVAEADAENGVTWLDPAPFQDTYRLAVTRDFAEENGLANMSDVAGSDAEQTLCAASEFVNRADGLIGLEETYGTDFSVTELDLGLVFTQLGQSCNFGEVFSTDGRIIAQDLVVLEDDEEFFIPFNGVLTVRTEVLDANPGIADLFGPVSEALDNETITTLNAQVDVDGESPEDVARGFLVDNGMISE
ncbi:MAG: glycine betaine ABC transporter substrate-binding protein [Euzebya sp.]